MAGRDTVENVDIKITAKDDASKTIDGIAKAVDDLDDVEVTAKPLSEGDRLKADIKGILDEARLADRQDIDIDVDIDQAKVQKVKGNLDDVRQKGETIGTGAVNSLADLTGPLGDVSGQVSDFGQAFVGAAELAGPALDKVGVDVSQFAGLLGVGGVALGAAIFFWDMFNSGAEDAKKRLDEVKDAQLALARGDVTKSVEVLQKQYDKFATSLKGAGISQAAYAKMITENIPLTDAQTKAIANAGGALDFSTDTLSRNRLEWQKATGDLQASQSAQFEMAKAIGATSAQLIDMATNAIPPVQAQILAYVAQVNGIPSAKFTSIMTDADPDNVKQVEDEIARLARDRDALVKVDADLTPFERTMQAALNSIRNTVLKVPVVAGTTSSAPSSTVAGVDSRAAGRAAPSGGTSITYNVTVTMPVGAPTAEVGRFVADALDAHERRSGSRRRVA